MSHKQVPPVNDFWHRKISFYFNEILDVNSDGVVNALDIDVFRNLCLQMKNPNVDSHAFKTFSEFLEIWLKTIKDSSDTLNEDVSLEEFKKYCQTIRKQLYGLDELPDSLKYLNDYLNGLFFMLDVDGDGIISKTDYINAYSDFEDAFERERYWSYLCQNQSDQTFQIDNELFKKLCIEFLVSTNPEDRGNYLFGLF